MSSTYGGVPGDIVFPVALAIANSTNATPITVNTTLPHGLLTGDVVAIYNHQTNINANGLWTITRTGANAMTLNGSSSASAGGATGTVQPLTFGAATTIPSDGDARNAASVNVPFETLLDRTSALVPAFPGMKLAGQVVFNQASLTGTGWASYSGTLSATTITAMTLSALASFALVGQSSLTAHLLTGPYAVSGVMGSDLLRVTLRTSYDQSTATNPIIVLMGAQVAPGAAAPAFGSYTQISMASCPTGNPASSAVTAIVADGFASVSAGDFYVQPALYSVAGGVTTAGLLNDTTLTVQAWRATGVPQ